MASIFATPGSPDWWSLGLHGGPKAALDSQDAEAAQSGGGGLAHADLAAIAEQEAARAASITPVLPYSPHAAFLSAAATGGTQQMVDVLQQHPDAIFSQNSNGMTAAHLAVWEGHIVSLCFLANRDRRCLEVCDKFGQFPVHLAAWTGDVQVLRLIHNLDPNLLAQRTPQGCSAAHMAAKGTRPHTISLFSQLAPWLLEVRDARGRLPVDLCPSHADLALDHQAMQEQFSVEVIMHGIQTL